MKINVEFNSVSEMVNFSKFVGADLTNPELSIEKQKELEWYKDAYKKTFANLERAYERLRSMEVIPQGEGKNAQILVEDFLPLSVRAMNCLRSENIYYMEDLLSRSALDLQKIYNFGKGTLKEIRELLANHNLKLRDD